MSTHSNINHRAPSVVEYRGEWWIVHTVGTTQKRTRVGLPVDLKGIKSYFLIPPGAECGSPSWIALGALPDKQKKKQLGWLNLNDFDTKRGNEKKRVWQRSVHAKSIQIAIDRIIAARIDVRDGIATPKPRVLRRVDWETLLANYIASRNSGHADTPIAEKTMSNYRNAIARLTRFDPDITIAGINRAWLLRFYEWNVQDNFKMNGLFGYWQFYRAIMRYAIAEGLAPVEKYMDEDGMMKGRNPFKGIRIQRRAVDRPPIQWRDERRLYEFLYLKNRPLFSLFLFQRLTGLRIGEVCGLPWDADTIKGLQREAFVALGNDLDEETFTYINYHAELCPITPAVGWILRQLPRMGPYVFQERDPSEVGKQITRACAHLGIRQIQSHDNRRTYQAEFRRLKPRPTHEEEQILDHHAPTRKTAMGRTYSSSIAECAIRRDWQEITQAKWLTFFDSLGDLIDDGIPFSFANPDSNASRKRIEHFTAAQIHAAAEHLVTGPASSQDIYACMLRKGAIAPMPGDIPTMTFAMRFRATAKMDPLARTLFAYNPTKRLYSLSTP